MCRAIASSNVNHWTNTPSGDLQEVRETTKIKVKKYQTVTLRPIGDNPVYIKELKLEERATLNMGAGIYFVNSLNMGKKNAVINVLSEPVVLHT